MLRGRVLRSRKYAVPRRSTAMRALRVRRPFGGLPVRKAPVAQSVYSRPGYGVKVNTGSTRVTQREYVATLVYAANTTGFQKGEQLGFPANDYMNPVNTNIFTWASQIAKAFEFYKFERCALVYEPVCNTNVGGTVALAFENDPLDGLPGSFAQMSQYKGCVHGAPWAPHRMDIPFADLNRRRLYYTSVTDKDRRESDTGRFIVAAQDITVAAGTAPSPTPLGQVYVEYTLRLWSPEVPTSTLGAVTLPPNENGLYGEYVTSNAPAGQNFFVDTATITNTGSGTTVIANDGTFLTRCEVLIVATTLGTSLGAYSVAGSTVTAVDTLGSLINAAGTQSNVLLKIKAESGQKLVLVAAGTTVTSRYLRIASYSYDLP